MAIHDYPRAPAHSHRRAHRRTPRPDHGHPGLGARVRVADADQDRRPLRHRGLRPHRARQRAGHPGRQLHQDRRRSLRTDVGALLPTGKPDLGFEASTNGEVRAVAASEDGSRIFIGGTFTEVNGVPRQNLAAIDAVTGALIPDWQADTTGTVPMVKSLAVHDDRLYVGGKFTGIDGTAKQKLAALNVTTGNLVTWNTRDQRQRQRGPGLTRWRDRVGGRLLHQDQGGRAALLRRHRRRLGTCRPRSTEVRTVATSSLSRSMLTEARSTPARRTTPSSPTNRPMSNEPALDQEAGWQHARDRDLADRDLRRRALRRHDPVPDQHRPLDGCPDRLGPESHRYQERDLVPGHPRQHPARRRAVHPLPRRAAAALRAVRRNADAVTPGVGYRKPVAQPVSPGADHVRSRRFRRAS